MTLCKYYQTYPTKMVCREKATHRVLWEGHFVGHVCLDHMRRIINDKTPSYGFKPMRRKAKPGKGKGEG